MRINKSKTNVDLETLQESLKSIREKLSKMANKNSDQIPGPSVENEM